MNPQPSIILITLLAFGLRSYRLDQQSLWIDEAWTVYFIRLSWAELWTWLQTVEIVPPLYYLAIRQWAVLVGESEFGLRYFSVVFSLLVVPLSYQLGKRLAGPPLGLLTALLLAVAPFQIWYAQEARLYGAFMAASAMSMGSFVRLQFERWDLGLSGRRGQTSLTWWMLYLISTVLAIGLHYHGVMLIGVQGLFLLLTGRHRWRGYLAWGGTIALMLLLLSPWLWLTASRIGQHQTWLTQPTLWQAFVRSGTAYSIGHLLPREQAIPLTIPFAMLYGIGLVYAATKLKPPSRQELRRLSLSKSGSTSSSRDSTKFCATPSRPPRGWSGSDRLLFLLSFTLAPIFVAWLYGELRTPIYFERYLIFVQLGYLLTVATGLLGIERIACFVFRRQFPESPPPFSLLPSTASLLPPTLSLLLLIPSLNSYYHDPTYAKANWRGVAEMVDAFGEPSDGILLTGDGGEHAFNYYYDGNLPIHHPFNLSLLNPTPPPSDGAAMKTLADLMERHDRLWYTPYGTELDGVLEQWLITHAYPAWHRWLGTKRLALYGRPDLPVERQIKLEAAINEQVTLQTINLPNQPLKANGLLPVKLVWHLADGPSQAYRLSLRLTNQRGDIFVQNDWPPLQPQLERGHQPSSTDGSTVSTGSVSTGSTDGSAISTGSVSTSSTDGSAVSAGSVSTSSTDGSAVSTGSVSTGSTDGPNHRTTRHALWIPADVPPAEYVLQFVIYDGLSGQTLHEPIPIDGLTIEAASIVPPEPWLSLPNPTRQPLGPLTLRGYVLPEQIRPGESLWVWLYWQCATPACATQADSEIRLHLGEHVQTAFVDSLKNSVGETDTWQVGQQRKAIYHLPTSPQLRGDSADLQVRLWDKETPIDITTTIGPIRLQQRARQFNRPAMPHALELSLGQPPSIRLLGYTLAQSPDSLSLTLHWQAVTEISRSYTVFVQLLNQAGHVVRQVDRLPLQGEAPTTTWQPPEIISDSYLLTLQELPAGDYRLIVGLYDALTGQRMPIDNGSDFVELTPININRTYAKP